MAKEKRDIFEVTCPHCQSSMWIDAASRTVLKVEKGAGKKKSLDELLAREQERRATFNRKFEATAELERRKKEKAREKFAAALKKAGAD
ncbi:MAG: hypothetical protein ACUVR0_10020 [Candidatus Aminicenantales bacterium]